MAATCCYIAQANEVSHFNTLLTPFLITSLLDFVVPLSLFQPFFYFHPSPKTACTYEVTSVNPRLPPVLHLSHVILQWGFR